MKLKIKIYNIVLNMLLKDKDKLLLTGKQKSQIESLIRKINYENISKWNAKEKRKMLIL